MKCPVCKSDNLKTEIGGLNQIYKCKKCNYSGNFVLDEEEALA